MEPKPWGIALDRTSLPGHPLPQGEGKGCRLFRRAAAISFVNLSMNAFLFLPAYSKL